MKDYSPGTVSASKPIEDVSQHESVRAGPNAIARISSGVVVPGKAIIVPLEVLNVKNLASVEIEVRYEPSVLGFAACNADPGAVFDLALCEKFDDDGVSPDTVRFTAISTAGVSGDIVLARIAFKIVGQPKGLSALDVEVLTFADVQGDSIGVSTRYR